MAESADRRFYVSWVDRRKDPWPKWADQTDGRATKKGKALTLRAKDDAEWPLVPQVLDDAHPWQHLGPTLTTFFHPRSPYRHFAGLDRVYLLYEEELSERSPHEKLRQVMERLCAARGISDFERRVQLVGIRGMSDHTEHKQMLDKLEAWVRSDADPFNLRRKPGKNPPQIVINLSPGTPISHACWLMLRWSGCLGDPPATFVKFVQCDRGMYADEGVRDPVRDVPIDVLSRFIGKEPRRPATVPTPADDWVRMENLHAEAYQDLRQMIEQAAFLGLPIVLYGERGTGKTFLARYYHERRQAYRRQTSSPATKAAVKKGTPDTPSNAPPPHAEGHFVPVTLSEYANLHELRDQLFGWRKGSWTGADYEYHGLLGKAHRGTLFLDEIHHLDRTLQALLLGVLNNRRYQPKMADYELESQFDLVVATNDPQWRSTLADDFRDRVERIVLEVPSFRTLQRQSLADLWLFWDHTLRRRCRECGVEHTDITEECRRVLDALFRHRPLAGNWRDLTRLADHVLLLLTEAREGRPTPLTWRPERLELAVHQAFRDET